MIGQRHAVVSSVALLVIAIIAEVANAGPRGRIVGGDEASPGEFPYIVSLREDDEHICGGAIVGSSHVLTAAHCVYDAMLFPFSTITVVTGTTSSSSGGKTYIVSDIIVHKGFDGMIPISSNDIALLKLETDIVFDTYTSPINLPRAVTPDGAPAVVAGWGTRSESSQMVSPNLQKANMTTVGPAVCELLMEDEIFREQICAINVPGIGICQGDSGGPIVAGNEVIGVASYNIPCAQGYPDVYTAVYYFVDWIKKKMQ